MRGGFSFSHTSLSLSLFQESVLISTSLDLDAPSASWIEEPCFCFPSRGTKDEMTSSPSYTSTTIPTTITPSYPHPPRSSAPTDLQPVLEDLSGNLWSSSSGDTANVSELRKWFVRNSTRGKWMKINRIRETLMSGIKSCDEEAESGRKQGKEGNDGKKQREKNENQQGGEALGNEKRRQKDGNEDEKEQEWVGVHRLFLDIQLVEVLGRVSGVLCCGGRGCVVFLMIVGTC